MRIARFNCHAIREVIKSKDKVDTLSIGNVFNFSMSNTYNDTAHKNEPKVIFRILQCVQFAIVL